MRKISKSIKQAIAKAENLIGSGCERSCFSLGGKYIVKLNVDGESCRQTREEKEIYELMCKYYPEIAEEYIIPFVFFGKYNGKYYCIAEKASVLSELRVEIKRIYEKFEGLSNSIVFDNIGRTYAVLKHARDEKDITFDFETKKFKREYREIRMYYTESELRNLELDEVLELIKLKNKENDEGDKFNKVAWNLEKDLREKGFSEVISDVHRGNVGIHNGKGKVIDLGYFSAHALKRKIQRDFNLTIEDLWG